MSKLLAVIALVSVPVLGGAQNLVQNGDFSVGVNHWSYYTDRMDWIADDGVAAPGCMELGHSFNNGGSVGAFQEIPVAESTTYQLRAWARIPTGSVAPNVLVYADWRNTSGQSLGYSQVYFGTTPTDPAWMEIGGEVTSAAGATSAEVRISLLTAPGGTDEAVARFDDVYFGPPGGSSDVFADGFESGDTGAWSASHP